MSSGVLLGPNALRELPARNAHSGNEGALDTPVP